MAELDPIVTEATARLLGAKRIRLGIAAGLTLNVVRVGGRRQ
jgi:hypothetical protein